MSKPIKVLMPETQRALLADFAELVIEWRNAVDVLALAKNLVEIGGVRRERFVRTGEIEQ